MMCLDQDSEQRTNDFLCFQKMWDVIYPKEMRIVFGVNDKGGNFKSFPRLSKKQQKFV